MKVIQVIPNFEIGGAEVMCENLIYELREQGIEVVVISLYNFETAITKRLQDRKIKVVFLNKKKGFDVSIIFKLYQIFNKEKPDVVHTHLYAIKYAMIAAIFSGVKCRVHTVHNIAQKECEKLDKKINKMLYRHCGVIPVALSNIIKNTIIEEYNINRNDIPVIFNGINLSNAIEKKDYDIKGKIKIIHIGRFSKQKNHIGLIQIFEELYNINKNVELILIGIGEEKEKIEKMVLEKNINNSVKFLGQQDDVYKYLNQADIFVFPSLWEGIPMTIIEAMATGLPIVATNVGGINDMLVDYEEALVVEVDNKKILESILSLINNEKLRKKLGENAKEKSKKFSSKFMAKGYINVYKKS